MTKKFKFRLERVRELKSAIKQDKLRELSKALANLYEAESILETLYAAWGSGSVELNTPKPIHEVIQEAEYRAGLKAKVIKQRDEIKSLQEIADKAREVYIEAHKDSEIYEQLKGKAREAYDFEVAQEEAKNLDEMAVQRAARRE